MFLAPTIVSATLATGGMFAVGTANAEQAIPVQPALTTEAAVGTATAGKRFKITKPPKSLRKIRKKIPKYTKVFGLGIAATKGTSNAKIQHAGSVLAAYLDNNEDGKPDNKKVWKKLKKSGAIILMTVDEAEAEGLGHKLERKVRVPMQGLRADETDPVDQFDASLEEIHHFVYDHGWAKAYRKQLGSTKRTKLAKAMNVARGGKFNRPPAEYPAGAWFTYEDRSCDYRCNISEYIYWAHTSYLGAQADRFEDIGQEWRLNTRAKLLAGDKRVSKLLTTKKFKMPRTLPTGTYRPS